MSGFEIDDVRELFTEDMARFSVELATQTAVLRSALLEVTGRLGEIEKAADAAAVAFHAVAGTSSLLHIESTRRVALELEHVSSKMIERVRAMVSHGVELERMCSACEHGNLGLNSLVASELDKQRDVADAASADILREVQRRISVPVPTSPAGAGEQQELFAIFQQELATAMTEVLGLLGELEAGADRAGALSRLAGILHMVKGAAASVGATSIEIELRGAYETIEDFLDRGDLPTASEVRRIREDLTIAIAITPTSPSLDDSWSDDATTGQDDAVLDPREIFRVEARDLLREANTRRGGVSFAERDVPLLAKLFHRLKGSALVVDEPVIAALAAALEVQAREGRPPDPEAYRELERLVDGGSSTLPHAAIERVAVEAIDDELWESFAEEANELVETVEKHIRWLSDAQSGDHAANTISDLLGTVHTLKGAANAVGLSPIGRELHVVETILEQLQLDPTPARRSHVVRVLIDAVTRLRSNLRTVRAGRVEDGTRALEDESAALARLGTDPGGSSGSWIGASDAAWTRAPQLPSASGSEPVSASQESRERPTGRGGSDTRDSERRYVRVPAERLDALMDMVGELIISRSRVDAGLATLSVLHREQEQRRRRVTEIVESFTEQAEYANLGGQARRRREGNHLGFGVLEFDVYEEVHVFARRLAEATSDVGDTASGMIGGIARLAERTDELGRIVSTLQGQLNRARMVPLDTVFTRLSLAVHDAAEREQKQVDLATTGSEVVIDKVIADQLAAPLLHLVRNAVAHGVEPPNERRAVGKAERGRIRVSARQEAGEIFLEVDDDGRGLDHLALHRAGVAAGLLDPTLDPEAPEVTALVFAPGLSTSRGTTDVAGRGMGGDIIKKVIQRLGGSTTIVNRPGIGVTFQIRLPVTLAITRAVMIRQASRLFAIPMLFVERIVGLDDASLASDGRQLRYGQELLPIVHMAEDLAPKVFVVCVAGGRRLAIAADVVVSHEEVVVKRLGYVLDGHAYIAGASQRGDGEVALVLDMHGLAEHTAARARPTRAAARTTEPVAAREPQRPRATPVDTTLRVLFVDDSLSVRRVAEATLKRLGVAVVTANDGREALERLRDHAITVVFTDLEMPRMHGYELIQEMRLLPAYRAIPIVVVSSRSGDKHVKKAMEAGANEYLTKPFSDERFAQVLSKLVPGFRWGN
jgi:chemosensory pili system protein ChpA (sensor histidine kinase/response regulator)